MKRPLQAGLLALALLLDLSPAGASEASRKLTARGLYLIQSGFPADALKVFEQAVDEDPKDVDALYYRGMLRGNAGDLPASLHDLEAVLAAKPGFDQAALELGVGLVQTSRFTEAIRWLEQAQARPDLEAKASLYLGLAQLRLGKLDDARGNFKRVKSNDPKLAQAASYYAGVVDYQQGNFDEAAERFRQVRGQGLGSAFEKEAANFLQIMENRENVPYHLHGDLGFEYDTNVVLAPGDEALKDQAKVGNESDGRFTLAGGGNYTWNLDPLRLSLGYDFYQSLHFDLQEFNLQDHRPSVQLSGSRGPVQFGLLGEYNFYLKEASKFLQEGMVLPWIVVNETDRGRSEIYYRMRRRDFLQDKYEVRDAFNHSFGVRQQIFLGAPDRFLTVGYRFDTDDPVHSGDADRFTFIGNEVSGGIGWDLPFGVVGQATYAYRHETYRRASSIYVDTVTARRDNEHDILASLQRDLTETVSVSVGYSGTINNSNAAAFEYDRHITSVALSARW